MNSLLTSFEDIEDPRIDRTKKYPIKEIFFLILAAVICGVQSWCGVNSAKCNRKSICTVYGFII